jgi:hypothetical protein
MFFCWPKAMLHTRHKTITSADFIKNIWVLRKTLVINKSVVTITLADQLGNAGPLKIEVKLLETAMVDSAISGGIFKKSRILQAFNRWRSSESIVL